MMSSIRFFPRGTTSTDGDITLAELPDLLESSSGGWIDILSPGDDERRFMLKVLKLNELAVEDCFSDPVSRSWNYDDHRFIALRARDADSELDTEHLRVFLSGDLLVTVRHSEIPAMSDFLRRYHSRRVRRKADAVPEYLLYELLDAVADDWYRVLESYSDRLDVLEFQVTDMTTKYPGLLQDLHQIKQDLREIQKSTLPLEEIVARMLRPDQDFVSAENMVYFEDMAAVLRSLRHKVSNYQAGASSARDTYLSQTSMRLAESQARVAEVMTTLTIFAAIILPLTLISGIYGMNTDTLPLKDGNGFWYVLGLMGAFAAGMLFWFRSRGWIGNK